MSSFPPQAVQLAHDVDVLIVKHGVTSFLEKVLQWVDHHCEALNRLDAWESRRRHYFENMDSAHQDEAKPPNDHYLWDDMVVADDEGELNRLAARADAARREGVTHMASNAPARPVICGYVPPELHSSQRPIANLPLPLLNKPASILAKYAALCAVRDQILVKDIGVESPHFEILKSMVKNVVGEERWTILWSYLRDVEVDVAAMAEKNTSVEHPLEDQDSTETHEPPETPEDQELEHFTVGRREKKGPVPFFSCHTRICEVL